MTTKVVDDPEWGVLPDVVAMYGCSHGCAYEAGGLHGDDCGAMAPADALVVYLAAEECWRWASDRLEAGELSALRAELPPVCGEVDEVWLTRLVACFGDLMSCIDRGEAPWPRCTGDEMALQLVLAEAREAMEADDAGWSEVLVRLGCDPDEVDLDAAAELLLEDDDVLMLFDPHVEQLLYDDDARASLGLVNMLPLQWFLPFDTASER